MASKRYDLPHLAFFQGFEAAARTLSFTKAAEELFITQSAVSRQIKALEDHLGLKLFERRPRALQLTESGQALYRIATDVLDRLQSATDRLKAETRMRQLSVTTTTGFASLWLIPRLRPLIFWVPAPEALRVAIPELELTIGLTSISVCGWLKLKVTPPTCSRTCPCGPMCSRALVRDKAHPLKRPQDLAHHTLLHFDYAGAEIMYMDWGTWLTALGIGDLRPAGALHFSQYEQMIQAAISGQGVALGRQPLLNDLIASGALVTRLQWPLACNSPVSPDAGLFLWTEITRLVRLVA